MEYFLPFHDENCYANAPQYYVIHTLPVLSYISLERLLHQETEYSGDPVKMRPDLSSLGSSTAILETSGLGTKMVYLESIAKAQCVLDF